MADDIGDEVLALHGHMWRVRELLAQGDVDEVNQEIKRFERRATGPRDPLTASLACNVQAMMALVNGDIATGERLGPMAVELAEGYNDLALSFYGVLMAWTWWQQDRLAELEDSFREILDSSPADYPVVRAALCAPACPNSAAWMSPERNWTGWRLWVGRPWRTTRPRASR